MGFPWKKFGQVALGVGGIFVPGLSAAVQVVESNLSGLKGPQKKDAAIAIAKATVIAIESAAGDVVNDPAVVTATSEAIDAIVAAENAKSKLLAAIDAAKHAKNPQ